MVIIFYDISKKLVNTTNTTPVKLVQQYLFTDTGSFENYKFFEIFD